MSRRRPKAESHVRLYRHELESPAYRSLSPEARALLIEFRALYQGGENRVYMSIREMKKRLGGIGQVRAERARNELLDRGFIRVLTPGSFNRKCPHATEYALTHEPLDNKDGATAPKDFMRWKKKTVSMTSTVGRDNEYRSQSSGGEKRPRGTDDGYRPGPKKPRRGTGSEYTDKLPRGAAAVDSNAQFKLIVAALLTSQLR